MTSIRNEHRAPCACPIHTPPMTSTEQHNTYDPQLRDWRTADLLDAYRRWPSASVVAELARRGVILWHHGLNAPTTDAES